MREENREGRKGRKNEVKEGKKKITKKAMEEGS